MNEISESKLPLHQSLFWISPLSQYKYIVPNPARLVPFYRPNTTLRVLQNKRAPWISTVPSAHICCSTAIMTVSPDLLCPVWYWSIAIWGQYYPTSNWNRSFFSLYIESHSGDSTQWLKIREWSRRLRICALWPIEDVMGIFQNIRMVCNRLIGDRRVRDAMRFMFNG